MPNKTRSQPLKPDASNPASGELVEAFEVRPVARAVTPYKQKFGIPRQPQLADQVSGRIELLEPYDDPLALEGLEQVSHIWVLFLFHQIEPSRCQQLRVRPPRLGGNKKIGVFASRSTHRPNRIGQSLLEIDRIEGTTIYVRGLDLLDQTPIIDIKPYLPYVERLDQCHNHIAATTPPTVQVDWSVEASQQAQQWDESDGHTASLREMISQCLAQDPRPAYSELDCQRIYGMRFSQFDIRFGYTNNGDIRVIELIKIEN